MKSVSAHITNALSVGVQAQTQKDTDTRTWTFIDNKLHDDWTIFDVRTRIVNSIRDPI